MIFDRKTETFEDNVVYLRDELDYIKNIQTIGQDSYFIYQNVATVKTYTLGVGAILTDTVTFTADRQNNAFAELAYIKYNGAVNPANEDKYYFFEISKKVSTPDTKVTQWEVKANASAGTYNVIYYVLSFDTGVVSA